ncbi:FG-GAP-like repeat-containing protein [Calditrichota bacterium]
MITRLKSFVTAITVLISCISTSFAQITFTEHVITDNFDGAHSAWAADMDDDGDIDIIGTAQNVDELSWFENDGTQDFEEHVITNLFDVARYAIAADVDLDGDMDVVAVAWGASDVAWFENDGDQDFEEHTIAANFGGASMICAVDMDGDDDIDVVGAASNADDITWWENDGNQDFEEHTIDGNYNTTRNVHAEDVDGDGDIDVIGSAQDDAEVTWWENDGDQPPEFTEHTIVTNFTSAAGIYAVDLDSDNDMDIIGGSTGLNELCWWENDGGEDPDFTQNFISDEFSPRFTRAGDIDLDGDIDVVSIYGGEDLVVWFENDGEQDFTMHTISDTFDDPYTVVAFDIDGDLDLDILSAAYAGDEITWWESDLDPVRDATCEGTITDDLTGDEVEGAVVRIGTARDTTDVNGYYFAEAISGTRAVVIECQGYTRYLDEVEVEVGENTFDFTIVPLSTITGTITDSETGDGVADAEIGFGNRHTGISGENGDYIIENVEAGEYTVTIIAVGYFEFEDEAEVEVGENEFDFAIDILSGELTGVVTDELTGETLFGATVTAFDPETGEVYREVLTDEFGEYTAESLHDGVRYPVFASMDGYARSDTEEVLIHWDEDNEQDFELTPIFTRNIEQLQTDQELETWVATSGIVTQGSNTTDTEHTDIYIQDDTGWGIQVYSDTPTDPENNINRGDEINVTGFLVEVDDITRIINYEIVVSGTGNDLPDPLIESTGDMSQLSEREGTWAQISGEINRDPPNEGDYVLAVGDGSGYCDVRIIESTGIDLTNMSENDWGRFTGVIGLSRQGLSIIPNTQEDAERLPIDPPYDLTAETELLPLNDLHYLLVFLGWSHDHLDEWRSFNIYRDGEQIGNTTENSWIDTIEIDIESGYHWQFGVTASYDEVETEAVEIDIQYEAGIGNILFSGIPIAWALEAVYPNPFNPLLSIVVAVPQQSDLKVQIFNILGEDVATLAKGIYQPGYHKFTLDAGNLTSGIYFVKAVAPGKLNEVRKIVLMK